MKFPQSVFNTYAELGAMLKEKYNNGEFKKGKTFYVAQSSNTNKWCIVSEEDANGKVRGVTDSDWIKNLYRYQVDDPDDAGARYRRYIWRNGQWRQDYWMTSSFWTREGGNY